MRFYLGTTRNKLGLIVEDWYQADPNTRHFRKCLDGAKLYKPARLWGVSFSGVFIGVMTTVPAVTFEHRFGTDKTI